MGVGGIEREQRWVGGDGDGGSSDSQTWGSGVVQRKVTDGVAMRERMREGELYCGDAETTSLGWGDGGDEVMG